MTNPFGGTRRRIGPSTGLGVRRRIILGVALVAVLALVIIPWSASTLTDWLWFRSVHFESVFLTALTTRLWLFLIAGAAAFGFLYANFW